MKEKYTLTIGIPTYNEESNIGSLLKSLLTQEGDFILDKIIVVCDGCSDNTARKVYAFKKKSRKVELVEEESRKGKSACLNQIFALSQSDCLITLDADILIKDKRFIEKMALLIIKEETDFASNRLIPLKPESFFEKVLYASFCVKNEVFESLNKGENLYTCHGTSCAFSKRFYKSFYLPRIVSEDAYAFLWCRKFGYKYKFSKNATTYFKLPENLIDHEKQSIRFFQGKEELKAHFIPEFVDSSYNLPTLLVLRKTFKYFFKFPGEVISYFFILALMRITSLASPKVSVKWQIAKSTRLRS